jgi:hypothetical protein
VNPDFVTKWLAQHVKSQYKDMAVNVLQKHLNCEKNEDSVATFMFITNKGQALHSVLCPFITFFFKEGFHIRLRDILNIFNHFIFGYNTMFLALLPSSLDQGQNLVPYNGTNPVGFHNFTS